MDNSPILKIQISKEQATHAYHGKFTIFALKKTFFYMARISRGSSELSPSCFLKQ